MRVTWDAGPGVLADEAVRDAAQAALAYGGRADLDVDVVIVDEATLSDLHGRFLGDPSPTDVLAFDLGEEGSGPAAEVYVSVERACAEAERRAVAPGQELALYVVHGALHLCGHDDREEQPRADMRAAERAVMASLGYGLPDWEEA